MAVFVIAGVATAATTHRPHMGARSSAQGTVYWNPVRNYSDSFWNVYRWGGCRTKVNWYIDQTVPSSYHTNLQSAVAKWDNTSYCGPDFVKTTDASIARLKFRFESDGIYCGADHGIRAWYAIACRNSASSSTNQSWTIAFNGKASYGVGVSGRFDILSIAVNELGHVLYVDHNTQWHDGSVQANSCVWGATTCRVTNDLAFSDFSAHTVSCTNCGNRRTVLTGDWQTVRYIYGLSSAPCTTVCPTSTNLGSTSADSSSATELPYGESLPKLSVAELAAEEVAIEGGDEGMFAIIHYTVDE